jgi:hypothetical protein
VRPRAVLSALLVSLGLGACGGDPVGPLDAAVLADAGSGAADADAASGASDAQPVDAGVEDTGIEDTGIEDAGAEADAGVRATFGAVHAVLLARCGPCHVTQSSGRLSLAARDAAHRALVGVAAMARSCQGRGDRVVPGDAEASVLFRKVSGQDLCGAVMPPPPRARLSAEDQALIRDWIVEGAADD